MTPNIATNEVCRPRALVVEDQRRVRSAIARGLRRRGFEVDEAADGREALVAADAACPSIALVDLGLPVVDGFRVVARLKELYGTTLPVLVLSGNSEPSARLRAFDAGADDFVPKPVNIEELIRRIDAFERTRRAYRELEAEKDRAEHLRMYAAEASALLAHDLNNGLCIAIGNLEYLRDLRCLDGDAADALGASVRSVLRMAGLVRNFVDITRLEDAALIAQRNPTNVCSLLANAIGIHEPDARQRGVRLSFECTPMLNVPIDASLVERVIHNLLGNAVRHVNTGGSIRLRAHIESSTDDDPRPHLVLSVGNTGAPIPDTLRPTLFEKYVTGKAHPTRRGMGLYFCRLAAAAHDGRIGLVPDPPFDANFVLTFALEAP